MKDRQRKPKTQSGFASFSMHELAELIVNDNKPIQHELRTTKTSRIDAIKSHTK